MPIIFLVMILNSFLVVNGNFTLTPDMIKEEHEKFNKFIKSLEPDYDSILINFWKNWDYVILWNKWKEFSFIPYELAIFKFEKWIFEPKPGKKTMYSLYQILS